LEQPPIDIGETAQDLSHFKVVVGHGAHLGCELFADVLGAGLLLDLGGEVEAALGGVLMERTLEQEIEDGGDLPFDLIPAEEEGFALFAHWYAYIYAYYSPANSQRQGRKIEKTAK
jgi:hypothetical protein